MVRKLEVSAEDTPGTIIDRIAERRSLRLAPAESSPTDADPLHTSIHVSNLDRQTVGLHTNNQVIVTANPTTNNPDKHHDGGPSDQPSHNTVEWLGDKTADLADDRQDVLIARLLEIETKRARILEACQDDRLENVSSRIPEKLASYIKKYVSRRNQGNPKTPYTGQELYAEAIAWFRASHPLPPLIEEAEDDL
jgi:hypothetical protein